jgi:hypothetical protein
MILDFALPYVTTENDVDILVERLRNIDGITIEFVKAGINGRVTIKLDDTEDLPQPDDILALGVLIGSILTRCQFKSI